jgi:hypothetical protein
MMRKQLIAVLVVLLLLPISARASDVLYVLDFWPNDGIWLHVVSDSLNWEVHVINGLCGPPCEEVSVQGQAADLWVHDLVAHNTYVVNYQPAAWLTSIYPPDGTEVDVDYNIHAVWDCYDARSALNQQYVDTYSGGSMYFSLSMLPLCSSGDGDFQSGGGSPNSNFSWSELNGGFSTGNPNSPWGIVRTSLTTGLEATRTNYNRGGISLSSGYRTPSGNANVGGVFGSYHVRGRAADMYSSAYAWTQDEFNLMRQAAANTGNTVELLSWTTYADHHLHAAW